MAKDVKTPSLWPLKVVLLAAAAMVCLNLAMAVADVFDWFWLYRPKALALARELLCHVVLMCAAKALESALESASLQPWLAAQGLTTIASGVSACTFWAASALAGRALWALYWTVESHFPVLRIFLQQAISTAPVPFSRPLWR